MKYHIFRGWTSINPSYLSGFSKDKPIRQHLGPQGRFVSAEEAPSSLLEIIWSYMEDSVAEMFHDFQFWEWEGRG